MYTQVINMFYCVLNEIEAMNRTENIFIKFKSGFLSLKRSEILFKLQKYLIETFDNNYQ